MLEPVSLIVTNARVRTGNPTRPWVTSLAFRDGKLAVMGSSAEILKMAGSKTQIVDAHAQLIQLLPDIRIGTQFSVTIEADGRVSLQTGNG